MLAAPCMIAARSSRRLEQDKNPYEEGNEPEFIEEFSASEPATGIAPTLPVERPLTLSELAVRAEADARIAQELAHEAHYAALAAAAHAARLRADAAIEAAHLAEKAIREAPLKFEGEYIGTQTSVRSRKINRAA